MPTDLEIKRLIQSAAILSLSDETAHRRAAYRIAISAWKLYKIGDIQLANVIHVILARLGNFPAAEFMFKESQIPKNYDIPAGLLFELVEHEQKNTINLSDQNVLLTDFQKRLWDSFENQNLLSISAPTSAGKSFTLQKFLINELVNNNANFIVYLVPSRALLGQIAEALSQSLTSLGLEIPVITIPETKESLNLSRGIYVFTQERAYALLALENNIYFDIIVVDEAQTINAGARGVLLQVVIEQLILKNPKSKFFFGSPFSNNPNYFSFMFEQDLHPVKEQESPVIQNLIGADTVAGSNTVELKLYDNGKFTQLTTIKLEKDLPDEKSLFSYLCFYLGTNAKNIIYAGSPSACEDVADKIRQWIDADNEVKGVNHLENISDDTRDLVQFIKDHIHPKYFLADIVERGVSFHYGKMPAVLRRALEEHFSDNPDMKHLVCTSTLLHGVNLPAKNLFLLKPSEGNKWLTNNAESISAPSFWNLAGRAGRLGKDFEGNVFLVNRKEWKENPLEGEREQVIHASFYKILSSHRDSILQIAKSEVESLKGLEDGETAESAFVKLYSDYRRGALEKTFLRSPERLSAGYLEELKTAFESLNFDVPDEIIQNNIGISPHRQQRMLDYMLKCVQKNDSEKLIPLHPLADAWKNYVRIFSRFEKYFDGREKATKIPKRLASMSLSWMRGDSYPIIIKKQEELSNSENLPKIIRETMETIENVIRFRLVQYTKCYIELLKHVLILNGQNDKAQKIPSLPLYLEIGAASGTMISLIGIGFSRTTASIINDKAADKGMDRQQSYNWLRRENWDASDIPRVCKHEIRSILSK
ncbi:DEAD/DEAH box helicase [Pedobacter deserti]|uniref:DEAD/DEAH box helicase n=1 Tax=Pedobacter deserti TaxID=2817382 RepID=UPI00210ABAD6|nr:DEAD/DEAH box helicase [Pedobacter sp. SYSU D00382]